MKMIFAITAIAAAAVFTTGAVAANTNLSEDPEATALCLQEGLLNQRQVAAGWSCEMEEVSVSRLIGGGSRCQDATQVTLQAYNPAGNPSEDKVIELEEGDWGSSYPAVDGTCNYELIG